MISRRIIKKVNRNNIALIRSIDNVVHFGTFAFKKDFTGIVNIQDVAISIVLYTVDQFLFNWRSAQYY